MSLACRQGTPSISACCNRLCEKDMAGKRVASGEGQNRLLRVWLKLGGGGGGGGGGKGGCLWAGGGGGAGEREGREGGKRDGLGMSAGESGRAVGCWLGGGRGQGSSKGGIGGKSMLHRGGGG